MNEIHAVELRLRDFMDGPEGWGRASGREVYRRLVEFVESHPGTAVFRVSVAGVLRVDISFASETVIELARRYRGKKALCFVDLTDNDMVENWEAAAQRAQQPVMSWKGHRVTVLGMPPGQGTADALKFALDRSRARAAEYAASVANVSITNASTKFKQLWEQGFLLRLEAAAESGGVEYVYYAIR